MRMGTTMSCMGRRTLRPDTPSSTPSSASTTPVPARPNGGDFANILNPEYDPPVRLSAPTLSARRRSTATNSQRSHPTRSNLKQSKSRDAVREGLYRGLRLPVSNIALFARWDYKSSCIHVSMRYAFHSMISRILIWHPGSPPAAIWIKVQLLSKSSKIQFIVLQAQ
jgi:hypothetical protein